MTKFELIKALYDDILINELDVKAAVIRKIITYKEYRMITGKTFHKTKELMEELERENLLGG